MNKVGPAIFCLAAVCVGSLFIFPNSGLKLYVGGWIVIGAAWLAWAIYSLLHRRWPPLLCLVLAAALAILLFSPIAR